MGHFFKHKIVWITGASSGIGKALVGLLSKEGASLIISSNEKDELENVKERYYLSSNNIEVLELDLSSPQDLVEKSDYILKKYGKVDFLFNNGGISQRALAKETDVETDRKIMEIDYFGQVILTKKLLPTMIKNKSGHFIITSSVLGKIGVPMRTAYSAAKHALHGFYDSLRSEIWKKNIKITLICPAAVRTNIAKSALTGTGEKFGKNEDLITKGLSPEKCAIQILDAVRKGKEEVIVGKGIGRLAVPIKRLFPRIYSALVKRSDIT
jgi:dehydrogenase/reductase SDR family member 7B